MFRISGYRGGITRKRLFYDGKTTLTDPYGGRKVDLSGIGLVEYGTGWLQFLHKWDPLYHRVSVFLVKNPPHGT